MGAHLKTGLSGFRSLCLLHGFVTLGALIGNSDVSFLVDSGASHNFMSFALCKRLGLPVEKCVAVKVRLAN